MNDGLQNVIVKVQNIQKNFCDAREIMERAIKLMTQQRRKEEKILLTKKKKGKMKYCPAF
ncbi:MAG: hypothetical protein ACFFDN_43225 [Candidatus Hodarchaeota archaeon]